MAMHLLPQNSITGVVLHGLQSLTAATEFIVCRQALLHCILVMGDASTPWWGGGGEGVQGFTLKIGQSSSPNDELSLE